MNYSKPWILVTSAIIFSIVAFGLWNRFQPLATTSHQNTSVSTIDTQPFIPLRDICHCYLVSGSMGVDKLFDVPASQAIDHPLFAGSTVANGYSNVTVAPNGSHVAATYRDQTEVVLADIPLSEPKTIYSAPNGQLIAGLTWAADDSALVFGLENSKDLPPSEGVVPTILLKYDTATKKVTTLFKLSDVKVTHATAFYPEAIDHNANNIVVMTTTSDNQYFFSLWRSSTNTFTTFDGPGDGSSGIATYLNGVTYLVFKNTDKVEVFNLTTGVTNTLGMLKWFDGPYSGDSPDGRHVVFLQHETGQIRGSLALLDILNGTTTTITPAAIDINHTPSLVTWTPDGKYLVYADLNTNPIKFYAVHTDQGIQSPQPVSVPGIPNEDWIYQLIEK